MTTSDIAELDGIVDEIIGGNPREPFPGMPAPGDGDGPDTRLLCLAHVTHRVSDEEGPVPVPLPLLHGMGDLIGLAEEEIGTQDGFKIVVAPAPRQDLPYRLPRI